MNPQTWRLTEALIGMAIEIGLGMIAAAIGRRLGFFDETTND